MVKSILTKIFQLQRFTHPILPYTVNMDSVDVRWAFKVKAWNPTENQILAASSYIQTEEKQRISRFVFQDDAKSSLIGRLMIRKFLHLNTQIPYEEICLGRDEHGKPCLLGAGEKCIDFNISHQGDYVVLAGSTRNNVGIDIMKIEPPVNKNIKEFFRLMKKQFSEVEWKTIYNNSTEQQQVSCFYRLWCLKESYVKNIGVGITIPLNQISFSIKSPLSIGKMITDTELYEGHVSKKDWTFEETLLDEAHAVAVSIRTTPENHKLTTFVIIDYNDLVKEAKPIVKQDVSFAVKFMEKELKLS